MALATVVRIASFFKSMIQFYKSNKANLKKLAFIKKILILHFNVSNANNLHSCFYQRKE